jgi:hypothetical protein
MHFPERVCPAFCLRVGQRKTEGPEMIQRIKYRARYYWRAFFKFIFICPDCFSGMNSTPGGRAICPECGK